MNASPPVAGIAIELLPIGSVPAEQVEALLDRAFGPERHARTAYKVRGDAIALPQLSFAAIDGGMLIGTIQCWPVSLRGDDGATTPLVMVGPVAVAPDRQGSGIGRLLIHRALDAAQDAGLSHALMLIGDPEYYGRFFGFAATATGDWRLPGPVERHRLLARGDGIPAVAGDLGPADRPARTG
ncbi:Predicted N-acetyltransferase YhbS [Sphingomonas gellani]|uniref:Predicted N-acetyltransferase YhbS n=1 Tax=Sphingomonas gellani TaxID=1166340 RepID=A0A1H8EZA9_9SPHN|nr:N-acetyltransferase [Sphingomonas gellani]SEN24504.1 Predicted N-acetyltransferase YhbS [Sphingomonas gellani]